jgi:hypothetical protein
MQKITGKEELELIERLDMAARDKKAGYGLGGWLVIFQLRIYLGILLSLYMLIMYRHYIYSLIILLSCLCRQLFAFYSFTAEK